MCVCVCVCVCVLHIYCIYIARSPLILFQHLKRQSFLGGPLDLISVHTEELV